MNPSLQAAITQAVFGVLLLGLGIVAAHGGRDVIAWASLGAAALMFVFAADTFSKY
jgi:hypothetical protein